MVTQDKASSQVDTFNFQPGVINPSRSITKDDEAYLRDYALAALVISWDESTSGTPFEVMPGDITSIAIADDTVWYQINYHRAIPLNIDTFHAHRIRIKLHKAQLDELEAEVKQEQPVGIAGDSVGYQLTPDWEAIEELKSGRAHGMLDASNKFQPMCTEASCPYSNGYLQGYNSFFQPPQKPKPKAAKPKEWAVTYNSKWDWYIVWVGSSPIGRAANAEEGEQIAQRYIAGNKFWQEHRERVLAGYAS